MIIFPKIMLPTHESTLKIPYIKSFPLGFWYLLRFVHKFWDLQA